MASYSMDLRERVVRACDRDPGRGGQTRVAAAFGVSPAWVSTLLQRRRETGHYGPRMTQRGRKPAISGPLQERLEELIQQQPDATLAELRDRVGVNCSLAAMCTTLQRLGYRRKKRHFGPLSKIERMSASNASSGG